MAIRSVILSFGRGEVIDEGLGWSLKLINLRVSLSTNFFNIMLKKLVPGLILKSISLRLLPNC